MQILLGSYKKGLYLYPIKINFKNTDHMKILVNPKITINKPIKNKSFGFQVLLIKEDLEQLTIKARSHSGRSRGIVGKITRGGHFIVNQNYKYQTPIIDSNIKSKIDLTLDLIFGKTRDKKIQMGKKGLIQFN